MMGGQWAAVGGGVTADGDLGDSGQECWVTIIKKDVG